MKYLTKFANNLEYANTVNYSVLPNMSLLNDENSIKYRYFYHKPLTFRALQNNSSVRIINSGTPTNTINLEYNINGGNWQIYTITDYIYLNKYDFVQFRNANETPITQFNISNGNHRYFSFTGDIFADGNIMSLLSKNCETRSVGSLCFNKLFYGCNLKQNIYFPKNIVHSGTNTFNAMFQNSRISNISLEFYNLTKYALRSLFQGCAYLTDVTLNITGNSNHRDCMLATFYSCSNLQNIYFPGKFIGSEQIIVTCNKLKKIIIDNPTPSEIYSNTFNPLPSACRIYVPDESVDLYKEADVWSTYASQILGQSQLNS